MLWRTLHLFSTNRMYLNYASHSARNTTNHCKFAAKNPHKVLHCHHQPNIQHTNYSAQIKLLTKLISRKQVASLFHIFRFVCARRIALAESLRNSLHISNSISINVVYEFSFIQFKMIYSLQWKQTRAFLLSVCASTPTPTRKLTIRREIKNHLSSGRSEATFLTKSARCVNWNSPYRGTAEAGSSIGSFCRLENNYMIFFCFSIKRTFFSRKIN